MLSDCLNTCEVPIACRLELTYRHILEFHWWCAFFVVFLRQAVQKQCRTRGSHRSWRCNTLGWFGSWQSETFRLWCGRLCRIWLRLSNWGRQKYKAYRRRLLKGTFLWSAGCPVQVEDTDGELTNFYLQLHNFEVVKVVHYLVTKWAIFSFVIVDVAADKVGLNLLAFGFDWGKSFSI